MNWIELVAARIWRNLAGAPISEAAKEEIVAQAIEDTEAGRPFGYVEPEEKKKPKTEPMTSPAKKKGRKPSSLDSQFSEMMEKIRKEAAAKAATERLRLEMRKWGNWEPWLQ